MTAQDESEDDRGPVCELPGCKSNEEIRPAEFPPGITLYGCRSCREEYDAPVTPLTDGGVDRDTCEGCGRVEMPTRSILMKSGDREDLCESCFVEALEDGRVDPNDPRVETTEVA